MNSTPSKRFPACILATCCVPWNEDGSFAEETFRRSVRSLLTDLTGHVYIFGTAGEGYAVNESQFDEITGAFREETNRPGASGMVGIVSLSLSTIISRIERARTLGFRDFQLSLPSWGALSNRELDTFFRETCGRFPDCRFLHYNLPRAKRVLTPDEYKTLADRHSNLVATKHGGDSMNQCLGLLAKAPVLQHFFTETAFGFGALSSECGLLVSVASMNFAATKKYFAAGQARDTAALSSMQKELKAFTDDLVALGLPDAHMDGAYDKVFCRMHDDAFPLRLLPPYEGLREETYQKIVKLVREKYPAWLPR